MPKEFEKFTLEENIEPVCDICKGPHKISQHPYEEVFDTLISINKL